MPAFVVDKRCLCLKVIATGWTFIPVILDDVLVALVGMSGVLVKCFKG